jgi:hypothetical protein
MKLFTIEEANRLLVVVRPKLENIRAHYAVLATFREPVKAAASAAQHNGGGGMPSGTIYVKALYEVGKITTEIHEVGIQLKDYTRGLIDFPCLRDGRIVLLCWQLGEGDRIEWWHDLETGFAGREPL